MTAHDFFEYCRIAYISAQRKDDLLDDSLSGREMYKRYADGRDEGLLEIDENSPQEFADWLDGKHPAKSIGGHPWEIKRGGNTTHIDLFVSRPSSYQIFREDQQVFDVLYFDDLGRCKTRIKPFITWEPLPLLRAILK
jgi:hypothetical protein